MAQATKKLPAGVAPADTLKSIGKDINALTRKRAKITKAESALNALKAELEEDKAEVRRRLVAAGLESASGRDATVSVTEQEAIKIEDYGKTATWVFKKKERLSLFQNRISITAYREFKAAGEAPQGLSIIKLPKLSIRARSK